MDNKKRLELIKAEAAKSQSAKDLKSKELSEAIHGLTHQDPALHQEAVDAAKHYAAAVHKHLLERKIITGTSSNPKVLRLLPPLCLTEEHVDQFVLATDSYG